MKRDIETILSQWKADLRRRPLLIRGPRQVGKSYTVTDFGRREFEEFVTVNFEQNPNYASCFDTLDPSAIIDKLSLLTGFEIRPNKTLLFLDEIQQCPKAIASLRYFYEQNPELHVIGAGSLLEFALADTDFSMPVGRIKFLHMKPLSFAEFLTAFGENNARQQLAASEDPYSETLHEHLMPLVKKYMILGGMPAVLDEYLSSGSMQRCLEVQTLIVQTYKTDFGKYANTSKHKYLQKAFLQVPKLIGRKITYSQIDPDVQSRALKEAILLLEQAGVVHRIKKTSGDAPPLEAMANDNYYKTIFLDIGLMQNLCGLDREIALATDLIGINRGALAEQFVGQELIAYQDSHRTPLLHYWTRDAKSSQAEIDYLMTWGSSVIPVEVKAGKKGTLRSLHLYLEKYKMSFGVRISQAPFGFDKPILSVPFYALCRLEKELSKLLAV